MDWTVANGGNPLRSLQRHAGSMFGGCHIATVDGEYAPKDANGKYAIWYHAGAHGNLPTDIYHATSDDLIAWDVSPATPVLSHRGTMTSTPRALFDTPPARFSSRVSTSVAVIAPYRVACATLLGISALTLSAVLCPKNGVSGTGAGFAYDQVADPSPLVVGDTAYIAFDGDDNRAGATTHAAIGMGFATLG